MGCHNASATDPYECGQYFATHGKQMAVPEGTPCWRPSDRLGERTGMCYLGSCVEPHTLAAVPHCGNGGIDFGEECDCGTSIDPCCNCTSCKLTNASACSSTEPCCDPSTCSYKPYGTVCRAAVGSCDIEEVCTGVHGRCPNDRGKMWGSACKNAGVDSTCYAKVCLPSLDQQCSSKTAGAKPKGDKGYEGQWSSHHSCEALMCCNSCEQRNGNYNIEGVGLRTDPTFCYGCLQSISTTTFTVNGVSNT